MSFSSGQGGRAQRKSSFARSFFQSGSDSGAVLNNDSVEDPEQLLGLAESDQVQATEFGDEEVLEQYRIMAQHEASARVKENCGFDMEEYQQRRKAQAEAREAKKKSLGEGGAEKPSMVLPEPKLIAPSSVPPQPKAPPIPLPTRNTRFLEQKIKRVPELCVGVSVRGSNPSAPADEHVVRCLGCRGLLRVKILATLVSCPECNTVSPASSTRR